MEPVQYEIELERTNGPTDHTSAILPSLTKGQRLKVPVDGGLVYAEVIEVTKLTTDVPVKWKLLARELGTPRKARSRLINSTLQMMIDGRMSKGARRPRAFSGCSASLVRLAPHCREGFELDPGELA
jgi:hypothetical protein